MESEIVTEDSELITVERLCDRWLIVQEESPPLPNIILDRANAERLRDRLTELLGNG